MCLVFVFVFNSFCRDCLYFFRFVLSTSSNVFVSQIYLLLYNLEHSDDEELSEADQERIKGIQTAIFTVFVDSIMFSIILPSLAIYLQTFVDVEDSTYANWLGFISAAHPFGQLIASPLAGYYFTHRSVRECMAVFIGIFCVGALFYATATSATGLLISRLIQGIGDANLTVCRAYVAHVCHSKEKVKYMAYQGAGQGLGFAFGSALGGLLALIDTTIFGLTVDSNTAPGYFSVILGLLNIYSCVTYMKDFSHETGDKSDDENRVTLPPNRVGIIVGCVTFFFIISSFSVLLCITTIYLDVNYGWDTSAISIIFVAGSLLGIVAFKSVPSLNKKFSERYIMLSGFAIAAFAMAVMGGFGFFQPSIGWWMFGSCVFFLAHPLAMATNMSIYAKIVGPFKGDQGPYMGYITMSGSLASIVSPLWSAVVLAAEDYSGSFTFFSTGCMLMVGWAISLLEWNNLVPHPAEFAEKRLAGVPDNHYKTFDDISETSGKDVDEV